jgi:hypothetical protein
VYLHLANFAAILDLLSDNFIDDIAAASHTYNDMLCFWMPSILEDLVVSASNPCNIIEGVLHNAWDSFIIEVRRLSILEEGVAELALLSCMWVIRV